MQKTIHIRWSIKDYAKLQGKRGLAEINRHFMSGSGNKFWLVQKKNPSILISNVSPIFSRFLFHIIEKSIQFHSWLNKWLQIVQKLCQKCHFQLPIYYKLFGRFCRKIWGLRICYRECGWLWILLTKFLYLLSSSIQNIFRMRSSRILAVSSLTSLFASVALITPLLETKKRNF